MVNLGKLARQAKRLSDTQGDKIAKVVSKATDVVDDRTKGKYKDKLAKVDEVAQKLDKTKRGRADEEGLGGTNQAAGG